MSKRDEIKTETTAATPKRGFFSGDRVLWVIVVCLMVISTLVVYSSTAKMGYSPAYSSSTNDYLIRHLAYTALAALVMIVTFRLKARTYRRWATTLYIAAILFTLAAYIPGIGQTQNDAARWILIFGFRFQPSELLKLATIIYLAQQLSAKQREIPTLRIVPPLNPLRWTTPEGKRVWKEGFLPILFPIILSAAVIIKAHTSSAILVVLISFVMMLIARVNLRELGKMIGLGCAAALLMALLGLGRAETASGRLSTWIDLWTSSQIEKPVRELTDTERSMIAIHDGGLVGVGAGRSVMRAKITHPESDYIFAFFVEEYGIILAFFLIMMYLWVFFRAMYIFRNCEWIFAGLLELGLALFITIQALLHVMVTINFLPETGQNLPLISHGGSSMLCTAIAFGIILSISRQAENGTLIPPRNESAMEQKK